MSLRIGCLLLLWPCLAWAAAGSWSRVVEGVLVGGPGRDYTSAWLQPPSMATGHITRVHWRMRVPTGRHVHARLCTRHRCIRLTRDRGVSKALAGVDATRALQFRFRLSEGACEGVRLGAMQLIVDYR